MLTRRNKYLLCTCIALSLVFLASTWNYRQNIPDLRHAVTEKIQENLSSSALKTSAPVPVPAPPAPATQEDVIIRPSPSTQSDGTTPTTNSNPTSTSTSTTVSGPASPTHPETKPKHNFKYKPLPSILASPIIDNFPLAASAQSAKDLPPIPPWNEPPARHVVEKTPLFIGFTRNWRLLQQVVVSYITAGWPVEDIYVVENTGVMNSNAKGLLSLQNPFFLNHTRLKLLGVNILVTPTLLSFAQLQNYYIYTSLERGCDTFFWSHMDIVALSFEEKYISKTNPPKNVSSDVGTGKGEGKGEANPPKNVSSDVGTGKGEEQGEEKYEGFKSLYMGCVETLREATKKNATTGKEEDWAMRFFFYDKLALVNVKAFVGLGGWDTQIPFYGTDCDMHARINMAGLEVKEVPAGWLIDVGSSLDDLYTLYRKEDSPAASFIDPQILEKKIKDAEEAEAEAKSKQVEAEAAKTEAAATATATSTATATAMEISGSKLIHEPEVERAAMRKRTLAKIRESESESESDAAKAKAQADTNAIANSKEAWYLPLTNLLLSKAPPWHSPSSTINSTSFTLLYNTLKAMEHSKATSSHGRNMWQSRQRGGEGDPFYRDARGFERGIEMAIEHGRAVFAEKWGHWGCDIWELGLQGGDAWRVERDW